MSTHRLEHDLVVPPLRPLGRAPATRPRGGIADRHAQQEAVELRLGQRIGALVLDRVLRCEHEERAGRAAGLALGGHLALLHRLEQRRLGLRRGAVDLVGEQQVGEDRAGPELEVGLALVVDRRAGHVGRHQVGRELDAREVHRRDARERARHQRLRQSGVVLDQDVAVGEHAEQQQLERVALADHGLLDLVEDALPAPCDVGELHRIHIASSRSATRARKSGSGDARGEAVGRRGAVGPQQLPPAAECLGARLACRRVRGAPPRSRAGGEQSKVQVVSGRRRQRHLALDPLERRAGVSLARAALPSSAGVERDRWRRVPARRLRLRRAPSMHQATDDEHVDVHADVRASRAWRAPM